LALQFCLSRFGPGSRVAGIRNTTFECEFAGTHDGKPCFTARMTTICVSPGERKAIRAPESLRARFAPHLAGAAA